MMKKIGLLNFVILACIGLLMRYKIGFEFPYLDQKHLQHGHSHFAFAGWVTHILYVLLTDFLKENNPNYSKRTLNGLIIANLVCAYGMLFSFIAQGYAFFSITFATLSVFVSYFYMYFFYKDVKTIAHPSKNWFRAALFFNSLSSLGTFSLAYMMATKTVVMNSYLASIYFYLHFQYNGWFFYACMGIFISFIKDFKTFQYNPKIFKLLFFSCIPAYLLSILWFNFPFWVYLPVVAVICCQFTALYFIFKMVKPLFTEVAQKWGPIVRLLLLCVAFALTLKYCLQAASIHPEIGKMAFGFRAIVIAYLHLVLLVLTSLFLIAFLIMNNTIQLNQLAKVSVLALIVGIFLNEFVLMIQGIASMGYVVIPYLNYFLFGITVLMFISLVGIFASLQKQT